MKVNTPSHILPLTSVGLINNLCKEYKIDIVHGQSPSTWAYSFLRERNIDVRRVRIITIPVKTEYRVGPRL